MQQTPQFKPVDTMTYDEAVTQLEQILAAIQNNKCSVDSLTVYTNRAAELLTACRARLTATEEELNAVLAGLDPA